MEDWERQDTGGACRTTYIPTRPFHLDHRGKQGDQEVCKGPSERPKFLSPVLPLPQANCSLHDNLMASLRRGIAKEIFYLSRNRRMWAIQEAVG